MTINIKERIERYKSKIPPISEGERNSTLYKIGCRLRKLFGLRGAKLYLVLCAINSTKCLSPLDDEEVNRIAASVDRSNAPLGDSSAPYTGEKSKKSSTPKRRTVYTVSASDVAVPVADLLQKEVSLYPHCKTNTPSGTATIAQVLEMFRIGKKFIPKIEAIRSEPDKEKRNALKVTLPAVVLSSEPQELRNAKTCTPNGMLMVDCDSIAADQMEAVRQAIMALPYVITTCLSVSGKGLCALIAYEGTPNVKQLLTALQTDFPCELDMSCSDLSRLRIVTSDPDQEIKTEVLPAVLTEQTETESADNGGNVSDSTPSQHVPFPIDCFPESMRNIVEEIQKVIGLQNSSLPATSCLAIVSASIGASCKIRIKKRYEQPAHIYTAIIGRSTDGKSPVLENLLEVLHNIESVWMDEWRSADNIYQLELMRWRDISKKDRPLPPIKPIPKQMIVTDITIETIGLRLQENQLGLLLYADEMEMLFSNMGRYSKGKDLPHYITLHNGKILKIDRKSKDERIYISHPSLAICGGIQPSVLQARLEENPDYFHSGFIGRFLIAMPPSRTPRLNRDEIPDEVWLRYERLIMDIISARESAMPGDRVYPMVFTITESAWDTLVEYQHRHAELADNETDKNATVEGKFCTNAARIALILHVAVLIENGTALSELTPVSGETMLNACIITEWFVNEAKRIYAAFSPQDDELATDDLTANRLTVGQQVVLTVLQNKGESMIRSKIHGASSATKKMTADDVEKALNELVRLGKVKRRWRKGKGPKAREYKIAEKSEDF